MVDKPVPLLAVVIVNYNVRYFLSLCLDSCARALQAFEEENGEGTVEVYVVDNNSKDASNQMLRAEYQWVTLIANEENLGFSKANNQALQHSKARYLLLLNPDTVIPEDTFLSAVQLMESDPEVGAIGVKMLDGRGTYLPESKRGVPNGSTAFFKMTGLNKVFPKSSFINHYYMGGLPNEGLHQVEILAGAFMLIRKNILEQVGYLDESFFMYGEDIDLSYRVLKHNAKVLYTSDPTIIHFKGESTKRGSLNYVRVFYKAMIIFSSKHFGTAASAGFNTAIRGTLLLSTILTTLRNFFKTIGLPLLDATLAYGALAGFVTYWERTIKYVHGGAYAGELYLVFLPLYIVLWSIGLWLSGSYIRPYRLSRVLPGVVGGTIAIAVLYAFLPDQYRYSRAIILAGAVATYFIALGTRGLLSQLQKNKSLQGVNNKALVVGSALSSTKASNILTHYKAPMQVVASVPPQTLTNQAELLRYAQLYNVGTIIFACADNAYSAIITAMEQSSKDPYEFLFLSEAGTFIIGSHFKNNRGDTYTLTTKYAIAEGINQFGKRILDVGVACLLLLALPLSIWLYRDKAALLANLWSVLTGKNSLVGYSARVVALEKGLPAIKPALLPSSSIVAEGEEFPLETLTRLDELYAANYTLGADIGILWRSLYYLDKQVRG